MDIQIIGRHMDVGDALRSRIETGLEGGVKKYFDRPADATVTVAKSGVFFEVDCSVHLSSGATFQAHGEASDAYAAFENALDKIEKRVRRYKRRLKDHHARAENKVSLAAAAFVLEAPAGFDEDADEDLPETAEGEEQPLVIAETRTPIHTLSVREAVLQLELQDGPALMFTNASNGRLNLVYRRPDGHIGWIDPQ